jgi:hypothetical protein
MRLSIKSAPTVCSSSPARSSLRPMLRRTHDPESAGKTVSGADLSVARKQPKSRRRRGRSPTTSCPTTRAT